MFGLSCIVIHICTLVLGGAFVFQRCVKKFKFILEKPRKLYMDLAVYIFCLLQHHSSVSSCSSISMCAVLEASHWYCLSDVRIRLSLNVNFQLRFSLGLYRSMIRSSFFPDIRKGWEICVSRLLAISKDHTKRTFCSLNELSI